MHSKKKKKKTCIQTCIIYAF